MHWRKQKQRGFEQLEDRNFLSGTPVELDLQIVGEETVSVLGGDRSAFVNGKNVFFGHPSLSTQRLGEDLIVLDEKGEWEVLHDFDGATLRSRAMFRYEDELIFATSGGNLYSTDGSRVNLIVSQAGSINRMIPIGPDLYVLGGRNTDPIWRLQRSNRQITPTRLRFNELIQPVGWMDDATAVDDYLMFFQRGTGTNHQAKKLSRSFSANTRLERVVATDYFSVNVIGTVDDRLLFRAKRDPTAREYELWSSDGTEDGTRQIGKELTKIYRSFVAIDNGFVFGADDGKIGSELWRTDGTPEGTTLVRDIQNDLDLGSNPGATLGLSVFSNSSVNGRALIHADDGLHGVEFWTTDGTEAGTEMLVDTSPGAEDCFCTVAANQPVDGKLVLSRADLGHEITPSWWLTDGTPDGTWTISDFLPDGLTDARPPALTHQGDLYFSAQFANGHWQIWKTNGTQDGTVIVFRNESSFRRADFLGSTGQSVLFSFYNGEIDQYEVVSISGEPGDAAQRLLGIQTLAGKFPSLNSPGNLFFTTRNTPDLTTEILWKSDGTQAGTHPVTRKLDGPLRAPIAMGTIDEQIHIFDQVSGSSRFWKWNKSEDQVTPTPMHPRGVSGSSSAFSAPEGDEFYHIGGKSFFFERVTDRDKRSRLWEHDGTIFRNMMEFPAVESAIVFKDKLLIASVDHILRIYDPVKNQFAVVAEFDHLEPFDQPSIINGEMYFVAEETDSHRRQLWRTDGTQDVTRVVSTDGASHVVGTFGNQILFAGIATANATAGLWASTPDGPRLLHGGVTPLGSTAVEIDGYLYFVGSEPSKGSEIWRTNGTADGTQMYVELNRVGDSNPILLGAIGSELILLAGDNPAKKTLWKANREGVFQLLGTELSDLGEIEKLDDRIYFTAKEASFSDPQLYVTDGSDDTGRVGLPRNDGSRIEAINAIDDRLYFSAASALWYIDNSPGPKGDATGDNIVDAFDIDFIRRGIGSPDVNEDGVTNELDVLAVLDILGTKSGDANLDGTVGFSDFLDLADNFGKRGGWAEGDFDGNGEVDFEDFLILSAQFG